jgi:serine/threonine-protein kinase HipA
MTDYATVKLWGHTVGYLAWNRSQGLADFEYESGFVNQGIDISPFYTIVQKPIFLR